MIRRTFLVSALAAVALAGAGCSSTGGSSPGAGASIPSSPAAKASAVTPDSVDPDFDYGQTVFITAQGLRPKWLVCIAQVPIVWKNETNRPQSIDFDHENVHSGKIPPGGEFTYTPPTAISITYHSGKLRGTLEVSPPGIAGSP